MSDSKGFDPSAILDPNRALIPAVQRVNSRLVRRGFWPKIRKLARKLPFAEDVVALWFCARDRETPMATKAMLTAALAYFVLPTDVVPDWFVGLGFTDDAAVIAAAIAIAGRAIRESHRLAARALLDRFADEA
ncbi:MAG TPA: YkvA family protein [Caulobacteraceae bacterium]|jgi:uncharacterized membrane protein YkvA (DUF1232 family)|nr:YkvA family protein [Caulobacteraceae bacterium]